MKLTKKQFGTLGLATMAVAAAMGTVAFASEGTADKTREAIVVQDTDGLPGGTKGKTEMAKIILYGDEKGVQETETTDVMYYYDVITSMDDTTLNKDGIDIRIEVDKAE